jgi:predicted RecA/RadA family phage recombinase
MAMAFVKGDGWCIDYTPSAAVAAGDVVLQGFMIGVAPEPIAAGVKGSLQVTGVAEFVKGTGDNGLTVGAIAYWDDAAKVATSTAASNKYLGKVVIGTTTEVLVKVLMGSMAVVNAVVTAGVVPSATVAASGTASGASPVALGFTLATAANDVKAVTLPPAAPGRTCIIKNNAAADLKVFPATGDSMNGGVVTTSYLLMADYTAAMFVAFDFTEWYSVSLIAS